MKFLLNISVDINSPLDTENFRGEGRWERNVLNALLMNNKDVHTTRNVWRCSAPIPSNLYDGLNESWLSESVLMVHGAGRSLYVERDDARAYLIQIHEPPFGQAKQDLLRYLSQNRVAMTVASYNNFIWSRIANIVGAENIYRVSGAMVPFTVDGANNFRKPNVTWVYRNFKSFIEEQSGDISSLFGFLEPILKKEPEIRVAIIIGIWDTGKFGPQPKSEELREWALNFPVLKKFKHLFNRIDFYVNLHWNEVINLLKETRWIISPAEPLGCPAYEAAMFGIPTIVNNGVNPFMSLDGGSLFPNLLTSSRRIDNEFLSMLDRLQNDYSFYRKVGDSYRNFTKETATFKAYTEQLEKIIDERQWNK